MRVVAKDRDEERRFLRAIEGFIENFEAVEEFIENNYESYLKNIPNGEYKKNVLKKVYKNHITKQEGKITHPISFTRGDIDFLKSLPNDKIKRLFYCLIIRTQVNPHPSGWISLDFEKTLLYGFSETQAKKIKMEDLSECVPYGFEVRVSGSTKPVLCFKIPQKGGETIFEFEDDVAFKKIAEVLTYERNSD